MLGLLIFNKS